MGTILFVDDARGCQQAIGAALQLRGFRVTLASTGHEAMEILKTESPMLVLLDLALPDVNGMDVLRHMQDGFRLSRIPVIVFTADVSAQRRKEAESLGALAVLVKSRVSLGQLMNAVKGCVAADIAVPEAFPRLAAS